MSENSSKNKKNLLKKLKSINMTNEKDILNMKVSELKKDKSKWRYTKINIKRYRNNMDYARGNRE